MKEAIVYKGPEVKIIDSPIPEPKDDQVVTKVIVSGSNPKDWYVLFSLYCSCLFFRFVVWVCNRLQSLYSPVLFLIVFIYFTIYRTNINLGKWQNG
jgi:hypothetical protein